jgi:hypothetical protein
MLSLRHKSEPLTLDRMLEDVAASVEQHFGALEETPNTTPLWTPLPGPQTMAVESDADELFFGGGGGGGKTDLILGLAITKHRSSIIFRREFSQFRGPEGIIERSRQIIGLNGRLNENLFIWRGLPAGRAIEFGAVQHEDHKNRYKGRPHDLKAFDELPEFTETQYRFLNIWLRTAIPGQRTRVVGTGNPPTTSEGQWVIRYWAPWLDPHHPKPAKPGELRWYAVLDGKDVELAGPEPLTHDGHVIHPRSRTFIPAKVEDNQYYMRTGYANVLDNLPEPLRSQMRFGNFQAAQSDHVWQVVPTAWVRAAQARWTPAPPPGMPLTAVGVDPSRGGADEFTIAKRHAQWFAPLEIHPGPSMPDGPTGANEIVRTIGGNQAVRVGIDIIGSAGSSVYDQARILRVNAAGLNGSEASQALDKSGRLSFFNKRAEWHWRLREALDPTSGQDIALPPDPQLLSDLCAPRWRVTPRGIQVEPKDDIKKRIGRSPDRGEAVIYAIADDGPSAASGVKDPTPGTTTHLERLRELTQRHRGPGRQPPAPEPPAPEPQPPSPPRRPWRRRGE